MDPMPRMVEEEEGDVELDNLGDADPLLKQGNHLFSTVPTPDVLVIASTMTTLQQLAEKAFWSTPAKDKESVPPYLQDFEDVFTKKSFNLLPEPKDLGPCH